MAQVDFIGPDFVNRLDKSVPSAEGTPLIRMICGLKPQGKAMETLAAGEEACRLRINIRRPASGRYKGSANGGGNVCFNPALCYKILGMNGSATKSALKNTLEGNDRQLRIERRTI